ncbi:uncharacterized protein ARMOST_18555 [Armillaria ostoyae]|uniref:Uncharacterized protein n=1 Tax=Armillaria ostoyae TaxID=47428 RepID=A0A284S238_ARMOS|nr:uncharacterized protein ARMOST_18555 [Armillaria ostoyae]
MDEPSIAKGDALEADVAWGGFQGKAMTSSLFANKVKGKERAAEVKEDKENIVPSQVDEAPVFQFSQTVFFAMDDKSKQSSNASTAPSVTSNDGENKVDELKKTCRYLEDEIDGARQESLREVCNCSEEALTAFQKRIVDLEREKVSWRRMEDMFREEIVTLEALVKERSDDVMRLKEALWTQEEEEQCFEKSLWPLQEEVEQLGNISIVFDDEFKRHMMEKEKEQEGEKERQMLAQAEWDQECQKLHLAIDKLEIEKAALKSEAETTRKDAKDDQDELRMLKAELESHWRLSETATKKIQALETAKTTLEKQCSALQVDVTELNAKIDRMEILQ